MIRDADQFDRFVDAVRGMEELPDIFGYAQVLDYAERMWFETGDMRFVLMAVKDCAHYGKVIPEWAANEFSNAYCKVASKRAGSWDDVFGKPIKKRERVENRRRRFDLAPRVWLAVVEILDQEPETPIDIHLFERVGKQEQVRLEKTVVGELWSQFPLKALYRKDRVKSA